VTHDLAVVGLGIVGAAAVHAATRAGARVAGIDAGAAGAGTSSTSFAWLNACKKEPEHYHRLNAEGMAVHRELAAELGDDGGHHPGGSLEWTESVEEREPGVASVSAPVAGKDGSLLAAVSVSGPVERMSRHPGKNFGGAVAHCARSLSAALAAS